MCEHRRIVRCDRIKKDTHAHAHPPSKPTRNAHEHPPSTPTRNAHLDDVFKGIVVELEPLQVVRVLDLRHVLHGEMRRDDTQTDRKKET